VVEDKLALLIRKLRAYGDAYPRDVFPPLSDAELDKYSAIVTRASAAMGRQCALVMAEAAEALERFQLSLSRKR
jgi:hypothetical protein